MNAAQKGSDPEKWSKLLELLDDKLQLGMLDHLERITAYHFEDDTLVIEPATEKDADYLSDSAQIQQLEVFAQTATGVKNVKLRKPSED